MAFVESWNHAAELLYGYSAAEAIGRHISFLVPPDRLDEMPTILDSIKRGQRIAYYETVRITKDGRRLDVFLSVSPAYEEGRIVGAASIARDNTEHKRLEELSRLYTKRLELIHEMDQKSFSTRRVANARNSLSAIWSRWLVCRA